MTLYTGEITPEREEELIRKIAETIVKYGMGTPAILFLETYKPLTYIGSQLGIVYLSWVLPLFGDLGYDALALFEKRENVERIIRTIEELMKEEDLKEKEEKERRRREKGEKEGPLQRLKSFFGLH